MFANAYDVIIRETSDNSRILESSFIKDIYYLIFENAFKVMVHLEQIRQRL